MPEPPPQASGGLARGSGSRPPRLIGRRDRHSTATRAGVRLLVPILRAQSASALLRIGDALLQAPGGSGNVLGLVEMPGSQAARVGREVAQRRRDLLRWIARLDEDREWGAGAALGILVRVAHDVALGIREAVYETGANLLLMEWPGLTSSRQHLLRRVVEELSQAPPADLLLVRPGTRLAAAGETPVRILAPIRGGPNAETAAGVASALASAWNGTATLLHLIDRQHPAGRQAQELENALRLAGGMRRAGVEMVEKAADDVGGAIVEAARHADLVVLGAYAERGRHPALVRPDLAASLRKLHGTVILVRTMRSIDASEGPFPDQ